jgi:hypothetical protein
MQIPQLSQVPISEPTLIQVTVDRYTTTFLQEQSLSTKRAKTLCSQTEYASKIENNKLKVVQLYTLSSLNDLQILIGHRSESSLASKFKTTSHASVVSK